MICNYVLTEVSLSKLTCYDCKKPLSCFPIYNSKAGPSCGRCKAPQTGGYRCEIFEEIAKNVEFPCCNKQNGCTEILLPKNVANHELHCEFQMFNCWFVSPYMCPVGWKGFGQHFLEHTKNMHPTRLLTDDCYFKLDFTKPQNEIKLLTYLDSLYLITINNNIPNSYTSMGPNGTFFFNVKQLWNKPVYNNLNYKITFEDSRKQFSHTVFVDFNDKFRIGKSELDNLLNNPAVVLASIKVLQKQPVNGSVTKNANAELLKHFECIVCMDYMIEPIYLCPKGHSICKSCRDRITACPTCRSQIQTARNYTLEGLASDFEFSCKCLFVGKGNLFKKHQETCNYIEKVCPLKKLYGCNKKLVYADLSDHIDKEHNKHWYKGDVISYSPFRFNQEYEKVFFLKYCSKLFWLNFSYRNELFTFVVKLMDSSEESSKYRFVVEILDTTENKNRWICSKNLKSEEQAIKIHFDSIEHLVNSSFNFRMFVQEN